MTEAILGIIIFLGGLVAFLFKRLQSVKKQRDENKQAVQILKQDTKTDQKTQEQKNEVEGYTTDAQLNDVFERLRKNTDR